MESSPKPNMAIHSLPTDEQDKAELDSFLALPTRYAIHGQNKAVLKWMEARLVKILTDVRLRLNQLDKPQRDEEARRVFKVRSR
jgi:hypothetical protein